MPQPIPGSFKLDHLISAQQKEALDGYLEYELDYFKNELNVTISDFKKEWFTVGARLYLLWSFNAAVPHIDKKNTASSTSGQIYISTVCFNQVLDLNSPIFNNKNYTAQVALLKKIAFTVKTYDNKLSVKK